MAPIFILATSAAAFYAVHRFCRRNGLYDDGSAGMGLMFVTVLNVVTAIATILALAIWGAVRFFGG